jgi:hypothetical protein
VLLKSKQQYAGSAAAHQDRAAQSTLERQSTIDIAAQMSANSDFFAPAWCG